jgi:regulatory protein
VLEARGLPAELVAATVAETFAGTDEGVAAVAVGRRRVAALRGLAPEVARRRLAGYLSRRGHGAGAIAEALRVLLPATDDDGPEGG